MEKLANEKHTQHIIPDEIRLYRNNCWIGSNIVSSDTMPVRYRADITQVLTFLRQLKKKKYSLLSKVAKHFFILMGLARILVTFFIWASPRRWTQHR